MLYLGEEYYCLKEVPCLKQEQQRTEDAHLKVVPIRMDANFFYERAVSSLDRYQYAKALKYFRRAVEFEPDNAVNHCNVAGVLSEMGDYEASNEVLSSVLRDVDPLMTECYFYMANNYANMEQFEEAEKALVTYLQEDASGQFLMEAEEMMELLQYELERPTPVTHIKSREGMMEHDQARLLLEEGKFAQAVKLLETIVNKHPDFLSARNNLALAYYYLGLFSKAMDTINQVLEQEPGNMHGLCNLAIFYQREGNEALLTPLVITLRKVVPYHYEHVFKLATTMGILGEDEEAYRHFKRLLKDEEMQYDPCLYHYTAVAAVNTGRLAESAKLWRYVQKLDSEAGVARYYLNELDLRVEGGNYRRLSYHYHLPFEERMIEWEGLGLEIPDGMKSDPMIRSSFFWGLRHGDSQTKLQVIQAMGLIADEEVQEALQHFLLEPNEEKHLQDIALFVLRSIGCKRTIPVKRGSETVMVDPSVVPYSLPTWKAEWQAVLDLSLTSMTRRYNVLELFDLETLWVEYLTTMHPNVPEISQPAVWSAALEYVTAKMHHKSITYQIVATRYGVSTSSVSRCARRLDEVSAVNRKLNQLLTLV